VPKWTDRGKGGKERWNVVSWAILKAWLSWRCGRRQRHAMHCRVSRHVSAASTGECEWYSSACAASAASAAPFRYGGGGMGWCRRGGVGRVGGRVVGQRACGALHLRFLLVCQRAYAVGHATRRRDDETTALCSIRLDSTRLNNGLPRKPPWHTYRLPPMATRHRGLAEASAISDLTGSLF
jgi:hypothetical protein